MSNALATRDPSMLTGPITHRAEHAPNIDTSDIILPKLYLGQAMSEVVQEMQVANGEIYKSTTRKAVGGNGKPVAIIPLSMSKSWSLYQDQGGTWKFKGKEPFTAQNANAEWEWTEAGTKWKRVKSLDFFVILQDEIERDIAMRKALEESGEFPDLDDALLPAALSFQVTSYNVGKVLATHFARAAEFGMPGYINYFLLDSVMIKGDKGRYAQFVLTKGGKTPKEQIQVAGKWKAIVSQDVRVDDEETDSHEPVNVSAAPLNIDPQF